MPQFQDAQGNIWEATGPNDPNPVFISGPQSGGAVTLPAAPPKPPEAPGRTPAGAYTEGLKQGHMWVDPNNPAAGQIPVPKAQDPNSKQTASRREQIKRSLAAVQQARKQAEKFLSTGSASQFLQNVPGVNQNRLNLETTLENAFSALVQDKVAELAEVNQGGVSGMANNIDEARRLGASIANLNANQDIGSLLAQLQQAEDYYLQQASFIEGKTEADRDVINAYLPAERVVELNSVKPDEAALATDGDTSVPVPPEFQARITRYLIENKDNLDPSQYAAFIKGLENEYGFRGLDIQSHVASGQQIGDYLRKGGNPAAVQAVPVKRELSAAEQAATAAAETPLGAGVASFANSMLAGIPARIAGKQEEMEAVRQNQPVTSFVGDMGGGIAGTMLLGGGLASAGARGLLANPILQNAAFGGVSGATQSEDPLTGAAIGLAASLGGDVLGRRIGQAFPETFAGNSVREAREAVPTIGQLKEQAADLYANVRAQGNTAMPDQTTGLLDQTRMTLADSGRIGPNGENLLQDGATKQAYGLIESFGGTTMSPQQAQTVRETLGEGLTSNIPKERRIAAQMLENFDNWAAPVMPGAAEAREVSSRYIRGQQLQDLAGLGSIRGQRMKGNDVADSTRTMFGQLDEKIAKGQAWFDPATKDAIANVARGDAYTNAMRAMGKYGFGSVLPTSGMMAAGASSAIAQTDPMLMAIPAAVGAVGTVARNLASRRTLQAAQDAELLALGGPKYQEALRQAREEAAIRAGRMGAGLFGSTAIVPFRD